MAKQFIRKYYWNYLKWNEGTPPSPNRWHRDNNEDGDREVKEERVEKGEGGEGKEMVVKLKNRFPRGSLLTEVSMISQFFVSALWNTPKSFFLFLALGSIVDG